ncbi:MAG: tetratricopeptide repeat protein [Bacteroidetes bacterium]|nr:MAG: tetratricopeptide repeat protein [Bacteroidota bacterium]
MIRSSHVPAGPKRLRRWVACGLLGVCLVMLVPAPAARAQRAPDRPEQAFAEAHALYTDGLFEQAARAFHAFRRAYPDHIDAPEAFYYEAEATLILGHSEQAVALFRAFQEAYPGHPLVYQARLTLGQFFYETGAYDRALETLEQVLAENPPPEVGGKALFWMGEAALNQGRPEQALIYYRRSADEYPTASTADAALYAIGYTLVRLDRYDEAARAFEVLAARYPSSSYALNIGLALAEIYYELGDYERTVQEINRRMPNLGDAARERATFLLAESYNQLRNSEQAILHYRRFTEANPDSPYYRRALYGLAWNYHFEGAYQWAAEEFARVRTGHTDALAEQASYYEGVNLKLAERPEEAIERFKETAIFWPDGALADHAYFELGVAQYELRQWAAARDAFTRVIEDHPDSDLLGDALRLRGYTYIALGNIDGALTDFDRAVELNAVTPALREEVLFQKAWLLYRNEQFAEARTAFMNLFQTASSRDQKGEALFWAAESAFQLGRLDEATQQFQQYLRDFTGGKNVDGAVYALGWCYFKQGRYEEAAQFFERFLRDYREQSDFVPYRRDAQLRLADSYYALGRYPEAIQAYARAAGDGEPYALYQMAQAFSNAGDAYQAADTFRRLLEEYPDSEWREEARYQLGYLYFLSQDYDQAIQQYEILIREHPRDPLVPKAKYGIGDALFNAGRLEEAVAAYRRVLAEHPNSSFAADAAAGVLYALIALGEDRRAEEIIEEFTAQHPDSPIIDELRYRLAETRYQAGRTEEALADFQRFIRTSGNTTLLPEAYYYLGTIFLEQQRTQEAEAYLRQIVQTYPSSPRAPVAAQQLGRLYLESGRNQEALALYRTMETLRPNDAQLIAQARYGQGRALLNLGRDREAETLLRNAVETAPDSPASLPALLGLARVHEKQGNLPEALRLYRQVAAQSRDEIGAEALLQLGTLLLQEGQARTAIEELSRMLVLFQGYSDWIARSYLVQARAFRTLGERGEAARLYDQILAEFPDTPYAATAEREKAAL